MGVRKLNIEIFRINLIYGIGTNIESYGIWIASVLYGLESQ